MKTTHFLIASLFASFASLSAFAELSAPKAVYQPKPVYAFDLYNAHLEGAVEVAFTVDQKGNLTHLKVLNSSNRVFEAPTLEALRRWKFTPAMQDGNPISYEVRQLVTYTGEWNTQKTANEVLPKPAQKNKG